MASKKDGESHVGSFLQDKTTVLQEARVFNESPISARRCRIVLTKIIYLLYVGETFSSHEATTLFFGCTKLFHHKDPSLRQMVYLVIKELSSMAQDVLMITQSILKDMQSSQEVIYRPNAIRTLCRITDPSMLTPLERFFKSFIVSPYTSISSSALLATYYLYHTSPASRDLLKRWTGEIQESILSTRQPPTSILGNYSPSGQYQPVQSTSWIAQYHALGTLWVLREKDRMAGVKMVQQFSGKQSAGGAGTVRSALGVCMIVRMARRVGEEDSNLRRPMLDLLEGYLRHKSDSVNYEAARAICEFKAVQPNELNRAVSVLQLFLSSPKAVLKLAAIRTLNKLSVTHPAVVASANSEMEKLVNDDNRGVAIFAITTLLKTGSESFVDRLMKQITSFFSEISDEFKIIVVKAIKTLCLKFPAKHSVLLGFLSGILRDEGGYEFKKTIVETIFEMIRNIKESKDNALAQLCEFIEDCEFTKLSVRILHLLGYEGPRSPQPSKFIRYIYNRVILENSIVRAAAVSSLAKFGMDVSDDTTKRSVVVLLKRCLMDTDDEVRDRAALYLKLLEKEKLAKEFKEDDSTYSLAALENSLVGYISSGAAATEVFDISSIPRMSKEAARLEVSRAANVRSEAAGLLGGMSVSMESEVEGKVEKREEERPNDYEEELKNIPEFEPFGKILRSGKVVELTEREMEYVVSVVKHVFKEHVVFQFNISNTIPDTVLENVSVIMTPSNDSLTEKFIIPIPSLSSSPDTCYVAFDRTDPSSYPSCSFTNTLKFVSKEVDPSSGEPEETGYEDEYPIEEVEVGAGDFIQPSYADFAKEWDRFRTGAEVKDTFELTEMKSLKAACTTLIDLLSMEALGGSDNPSSGAVHTLQLSGIVCGGGGKVLARCRMTFSAGSGVTMEMTVRGEKPASAALVLGAIG
ncbi:Coatomer, gamma subunit [Atractiella rhizophila]|nr:Coatomer, gamma subunit [Atractiella rhizophila]